MMVCSSGALDSGIKGLWVRILVQAVTFSPVFFTSQGNSIHAYCYGCTVFVPENYENQ